ncbi:MAG: HD domain-containing protein, partial [Planctomycetota bacterium]
PETDVPLTPRVQRLIDTAAFRRLSRISQLGLVSLVYPAAHHSRFEHSLGVYRNALLYLRQLSRDERFASVVSKRDAERFIVSALLHDIGHWPFCHPLEDIRHTDVPRHETLAREFVESGEVSHLLKDDWNLEPASIAGLLSGKVADESSHVLNSLLSGPIDVDKMDYLARDSLHAGVPYGRNFDQARLIGSLCLNESGDALAITDKGRTAAEMMVFARYVMFSEVYWHHAVRSATAMLQRAFFEMIGTLQVGQLFHETEQPMIDALLEASYQSPAENLLHGLFGPRRRLYKRLDQYSLFQRPEVYERLARRPYDWLVRCSKQLAGHLSSSIGREITPECVLIDAPPMKREIEIKIDVFFPKESRYRSLSEVSPVVQTLAKKQFDDYVKRVRVFVAPEWIDAVNEIDLAPLLQKSISEVD